MARLLAFMRWGDAGVWHGRLARGMETQGLGEAGLKRQPELSHPVEWVMQTLASLEGAEITNTPSEASKNGTRHVLEFEKPLAKLEQQLKDLEVLQAAKQVDYTKELRQLRTNYTSL